MYKIMYYGQRINVDSLWHKCLISIYLISIRTIGAIEFRKLQVINNSKESYDIPNDAQFPAMIYTYRPMWDLNDILGR